MDVALECPPSSQRRLRHGSLFESMQDSHTRGCDDLDSTHDRIDIPFRGSQMKQPHPKCPLDISADGYLTHDGAGAPTNPHNTPASNSEETSHGSSESGSYGQDCRHIHAVSDPKAENLSFGWPNDSQSIYAGYRAHGDEKLRRRRQPKSSITDPTFGVFSPPLDSLGSLEHPRSSGPEPDDETPFLRSPQFSPPPSFFSPPRIRFLRQPSSTRTADYLSADRQKRSLRRTKGSRRRHIQRPFPYRSPARSFHIPTGHTDRFPIPFPTILKLPFRRESPVRQPVEPNIQGGKAKSIKKPLQGLQSNAPVWQRLRECTMVRLSLHKSLLPNSDSTSYVCYIHINRSTFSVKFSRTTTLDKRLLSPNVDGSMVLFQISFLVPMLFLRLVALFGSFVCRLVPSRAVSAVIIFVDIVMSLLTALTLFVVRSFGLQVS